MTRLKTLKIVLFIAVSFSFLGCSKSRFTSTEGPAGAVSASQDTQPGSGDSAAEEALEEISNTKNPQTPSDSGAGNNTPNVASENDPFEGWSPEAIEAWEEFRDSIKNGKGPHGHKKKKKKKHRYGHHHHGRHHSHHGHHGHRHGSQCKCGKSSHNHDSPHHCDGNDNPKDPDSIAKKCKKLKNSGALRSLTKTIRFDDTKQESGRTQVCLFNQDGNLGKKNDFQQARYEQYRSFELPENAELCDLTMEMDRQSLKYDDMFYMSFNGVVIASNAGNDVKGLDTYPLNVSSEQVLVPGYSYEWEKIVGSPFNNNGGTDYCLGSEQDLAECQWPKTEKNGDFIFNYHPELLIALGAKSNDHKHELMFAITGDNDPNIDCYHEDIEFELKATYYIAD